MQFVAKKKQICWINQKGSNMCAGAVDPVVPSPTFFFNTLHSTENWGIFQVGGVGLIVYSWLMLVGYKWLYAINHHPVLIPFNHHF